MNDWMLSLCFYSYTDDVYASSHYYSYLKESNTFTYDRGTILQSNVVANDGTYPDNGVHSDGYWYVKKGLVNFNPTITNSTQGNETLTMA